VAGRGRPHLCIENLSAPRQLAPSVVSASHQSSGRKTQRPQIASHTLLLSMRSGHRAGATARGVEQSRKPLKPGGFGHSPALVHAD
jgi:hypothetical protein